MDEAVAVFSPVFSCFSHPSRFFTLIDLEFIR